jgi:chromate transporter
MINPLLYFLLFLKASLFSSGGFSNLPSLHQDLLGNGWAAESEFSQSIAIGQISPGPNGLWAISLGYLTYGLPGACLALLAITLPPFLVLAVAAGYARIAGQRWTAGLMRGISLAVIGILIFVCWTILQQRQIAWSGWVIASAAAALALTRRVPLVAILGVAGVAGYALYR